MKRFFEIFRAGNYPQGTFSEEDIQAIAKNYDPGYLEAPITLDHGWGGPAYGWIEELKAEGKRLLATFKDVSDELTAMVANKRYKTHSVEIYNELDGKGPYLKALAMLGAQAPQVKGMAPIEFSSFSEKFPDSTSAVIELEEPVEPEQALFSELMQAQLAGCNLSPEAFAKQTGTPQALLDDVLDQKFDDKVGAETLEAVSGLFEHFEASDFGASFLDSLKDALDLQAYSAEPVTYTEAEVNEKISTFEARLQTLSDELASQKQTTDEFKDENTRIKFEQRQADFASFVGDQVEAGRLLPKLKDKAVALFAHLDGLDSKDKQGKTPLALFSEIIAGLPVLDFKEFAKKRTTSVTPTPELTAQKAKKYQQEQADSGQPVSFTDAVNYIENQQQS